MKTIVCSHHRLVVSIRFKISNGLLKDLFLKYFPRPCNNFFPSERSVARHLPAKQQAGNRGAGQQSY